MKIPHQRGDKFHIHPTMITSIIFSYILFASYCVNIFALQQYFISHYNIISIKKNKQQTNLLTPKVWKK